MTTRELKAGWSQWTVVTVTVAVLVPIVGLLVVRGDAELLWLRWRELPRLEQSLGFKAGHVALPGVERPPFAIVEVVKGGPFDMAGVKPGDIPRGYHGAELEFLTSLVSGRDHGTATLHVTPKESAALGNWQVQRDVVVTFPPGAPNPPA